jgi:DNA repair exonuclease SbcCD ATPase subunit
VVHNKSQTTSLISISLLLLGTACGKIKSDKPEKVRDVVIVEYQTVDNPELVSRVETLQTEIDVLRDQLATEQNTRKELEEKLTAAEQAKAEAEAELKKCEQREADLKKAIEDLRIELAGLQDTSAANIKALKDELAAAESKLAEAQAEVSRLNQEIRHLQNRVFVIKVKISDVQVSSQFTACDGKASLTVEKDSVTIQAEQSQQKVTGAGSYGIEKDGKTLCTVQVVSFTLDVDVKAVAQKNAESTDQTVLGVCQDKACDEIASAFGVMTTQTSATN